MDFWQLFDARPVEANTDLHSVATLLAVAACVGDSDDVVADAAIIGSHYEVAKKLRSTLVEIAMVRTGSAASVQCHSVCGPLSRVCRDAVVLQDIRSRDFMSEFGKVGSKTVMESAAIEWPVGGDGVMGVTQLGG